MRLSFILIFFLFSVVNTKAQELKVPYELGQKNRTLSYAACLDLYSKLSAKHNGINLQAVGKTDAGLPLHVVMVSSESNPDLRTFRDSDKVNLLICNGIHPGEPEGIDASVMLARDLMENPKMNKLLEKVNVVILPIYNVGGALNRNSNSRANQNGPEEYGFRGNARNLDLNRDFIKADALNTFAFYQVYHELKPDVFIDNHTSNGADYQYAITLISTQKDKLDPNVSKCMTETINPSLFKKIAKDKFKMSPYVNPIKTIPDSGIVAFYDGPRYSTGYTAMFGSIGYVVETHMLKSFSERLEATYSFMKNIIQVLNESKDELLAARLKDQDHRRQAEQEVLRWENDWTKKEIIQFEGFEAIWKVSPVTGERQHYYSASPTSLEIPYFDSYKTSSSVKLPDAYIIPSAWRHVLARLKTNHVEMLMIERDMMLKLNAYYITDYNTRDKPYEGHYLHSNVKTEVRNMTIALHKGDFLIPIHQDAKHFIAQALEPEAPDSYFAWGFFDVILQQKEYFSSYVFDKEAEMMLAEDPELKEKFEEWKEANPVESKSTWYQLHFLYKHSKHYEKEHLRYPVYRFNGNWESVFR